MRRGMSKLSEANGGVVTEVCAFSQCIKLCLKSGHFTEYTLYLNKVKRKDVQHKVVFRVE